MRIVIIGASGAIGHAMVKKLTENSQISKIYAVSRSNMAFNTSVIHSVKMDLTNESSIEHAAKEIAAEGKVDYVIVATGMLHADHIQPEKSLKDVSADQFQHLFAVNTIGPALVAKHFVPIMHRNKKTVLAMLSARVGSISDNHLGGWYAYRASKAALNMIIKNVSIESKRRNKASVVIGLHPGTVDSPLSKPFQSNVDEGKLFSSDYAASQLLDVVFSITPEESGGIFAYDKSLIEY